MTKLETLYNAIKKDLPEGWEIITRKYPTNIIAFNPKFGTLGTLRIDLEHLIDHGIKIRFYPHNIRKFNDKNVAHFARLFTEEAHRLDKDLEELAT